VWCALHDFTVDVYLASFPYGGGRTLVEAMGAGVPTVLHSHVTNRMLGGFDMAYEGAFVWRQPEELLDYLQKIDSRILKAQSREARRWYERYHREEALSQTLRHSIPQFDVPPLRAQYQPNIFMLALQTADACTLRGILFRLFWRTYRRWRGLLGRF
jgi:hypothetical protein